MGSQTFASWNHWGEWLRRLSFVALLKAYRRRGTFSGRLRAYRQLSMTHPGVLTIGGALAVVLALAASVCKARLHFWSLASLTVERHALSFGLPVVLTVVVGGRDNLFRGRLRAAPRRTFWL